MDSELVHVFTSRSTRLPLSRTTWFFHHREDDKEYMSSESSQRGSSVGDSAGNMPYDYPSSRSASIPSVHEAAQGLAHLAMLASREHALSVGGEAAGTSLSRGNGHVPGRAPYQQAGQPESTHRGTARPIAGRGPSHSDAELGEDQTSSHACINRCLVDFSDESLSRTSVKFLSPC